MPPGGLPPLAGWEDRFFDTYEKTQLVGESCKAAGASRQFIRNQIKRNPEFAVRWEDAQARATEILEQIAVRRAAESSDTLLIFLLKARKPDVYRENVRHDHQHNVQGQIGLAILDGHQPVEFEATNRRAAAKALLAGEPQPDVIEGTVVDEPPQNGHKAA